MSIRSLLSFSVSALLSAVICAAAWADDLEIYLGSGNSAVTYDPNVLFIMDTSGSMASKDGGTQSRMLRVQNALKDTLTSATNINAGLMRFSDFGGPILYPVRPIDGTVTPELIVPITAGSDDASEQSGTVNLNSQYVKLSQGTSTVYTGLRFRDLNIPQGAVITSAFIRFNSNTLDTSATELVISGELTADATTFASTSNNISARATTAAKVVWNANNSFPVSGETVSTPDLSAVVQEIVNQADWCGGNSLNMIVKGSSTSSASNRQARSFEEGSGISPQLVIKYDDSNATGCVKGKLTYQVSSQSNNAEEKWNGYPATGTELTFNDNYNRFIGMRFRNIAIPKGAKITRAYLQFNAYQNGYGSASMKISAANQDDVASFNSYTRYLLRDKPKTSSVTWSGIPNWVRNKDYQSPDITAVVQQVFNRTGWKKGNDVMIIMSDFYGVRGGYTYRGKPSAAAKLIIEFKGSATPGSISTVRDHLKSKVDELSASGWTPIVDTLYEAVNYYAGSPVDYGLTRGTGAVSTTVRRNTRVSHRFSYLGSDSVLPTGCTADNLSSYNCITQYIPSGAKYISPIVDKQCQTNNHIVLLSDGIANNNHSVAKIEALLGKSCSGSGGEKCGSDLVSNISKSSNSVAGSRVITHTIGFAAGSTASRFLNKLALQSGGGFYEANNSADLVDAFKSILRSVKDVNATFVSPGVAVNQLNRLTHNDELYFALFKPAEGTIWPGNLKKYKIDGDVIRDKNGLNAVDSGTGFFSESAHSYWSTLADGNDVRLGGAASQLNLARNIYTFSGTGTIVSSGNKLHESNNSITAADLGVAGKPNEVLLRQEVLKWARGVDVRDDDADGSTADVRLQMGDPIHSQPVIVNYSVNESAILVSTNQGFLHSFDPDTGKENFAIIPKELLPNLHDFYQNSSTFSHIYGIDGDLVLRQDATKKWLYAGMRRGGKNYYVFDITNKTSPKLQFKIEGGKGDFTKLGQTWSRPTITKIKIGSTVRNVMIVGGGYDNDQDSKAVRSPDNVGNAVFIIDADDGSLIWSISNDNAKMLVPQMQYSIPARISVIDRENDGLADHMYVADTGGQLFRIDIYNGKTLNEMFKGGLLASFGGSTAAQNRRFYYGPDVSEISLANEHYYAVALGSGYRAHPLNDVIKDQFYMIKDKGVFSLNANGEYTLPTGGYTQASLYNASAHLLTSSTASVKKLATETFAEKHGWYLDLGSGGEKVLASPLILNYRIFFTTYLPATASNSACAPPTGNSRAYLVDLVNGNALLDLDKDGKLEHEDRHADLKQTGIAPETKVLIEDIVQPVVCLGTECTKAVIDPNKPCSSKFACLAEQIYGQYERVQKSSWKTETEREN